MKPVESYRALLLQGWVGMLFLLLSMLLTELIDVAIGGDFTALASHLARDPGAAGLAVLTGMICFNVIAQMLIRTIHRRACVMRALWITLAYTLFFAIHHGAHLLGGEGIRFNTLLDVTHHAVGLWAAWAAYRWAKSLDTDPSGGGRKLAQARHT